MKTDTTMRLMPAAPVGRLIKENTRERVSESAIKVLCTIMEEVATTVAARAVDLARHANRTTVKDVDIRLAFKQLKF